MLLMLDYIQVNTYQKLRVKIKAGGGNAYNYYVSKWPYGSWQHDEDKPEREGRESKHRVGHSSCGWRQWKQTSLSKELFDLADNVSSLHYQMYRNVRKSKCCCTGEVTSSDSAVRH